MGKLLKGAQNPGEIMSSCNFQSCKQNVFLIAAVACLSLPTFLSGCACSKSCGISLPCDSPRDPDREWLSEVAATEFADSPEEREFRLQETIVRAIQHHCATDQRLVCQVNESAAGDKYAHPPTAVVSVAADAATDSHFFLKKNLSQHALRAELAFWALVAAQTTGDSPTSVNSAQLAIDDFRSVLGLSSDTLPVAVAGPMAPQPPIQDTDQNIRHAILQRPEVLAAQMRATFLGNLADDDEESLLNEKLVAAEEALDTAEQTVAAQVVEYQAVVNQARTQLQSSDGAFFTTGSPTLAQCRERTANARYLWSTGRLLPTRGIMFERNYQYGWLWYACQSNGQCERSVVSRAYTPEEGDLILMTSAKPCWWDVSYAIARSGQPFHSTLVVKRYDGSLALMEAGGTEDLIVTLSSVKSRLEARYAWEEKPLVWVRKCRRQLTPAESQRLTRFAELRQGVPFTQTYHLFGNFWTPADLFQKRTHPDQDSWFCSEFVVTGCQCAGLLNTQIEPSNITPRDLMFNSRLNTRCLWDVPRLLTVQRKIPSDYACGSPDLFPESTNHAQRARATKSGFADFTPRGCLNATD